MRGFVVANNFPMPMSGSSGMEDHHLLAPDILCQNSQMKNLTATLCLMIAVLLGSAGVSFAANTQVRYWTSTAENGFAYAQYTLGVIYENGGNVPQNYRTAVNWMKESALKSVDPDLRRDGVSDYILGELYEDKKNLHKDYKEAVKWYRL
jgi:uncharacterized protein